jgi:predicted O-methyltransferase YrrM
VKKNFINYHFLKAAVFEIVAHFILKHRRFVMMKEIFSLFFAVALLPAVTLKSDVPEPYASMRDMPIDYYVFEDAYQVQTLALTAAAVPVVVDVGSEKGSCTRYLAQNLPDGKKIYSIETWYDHPEHPENHYAYHKFLNNLKLDGSANFVVPIRMSSLEAADALNAVADLVYLQSMKKSEVHASILAWFPHLSASGIICGNNWTWQDIEGGVLQAASDLNLHVHFNDNLWWLTKN